MKNKLNVYSNIKINKFLKSILSEYELTFMNLESVYNNLQTTQANIIIINKKNDIDLINFKNLNDNFLIIFNLKNNDLNFKQNIKSLKSPISINQIKNTIESFIENLKVQFHDICVDKEKLVNLKNDSQCHLTRVELEILCYLIREKETSKNFIKENILNIKSNIETNSLDSHLTRIRKKMNKIKSNVKIQTKNEKLLITI